MQDNSPYRLLLYWFSALFALRVLLQFVLQFIDTSLLPPFGLWHSGTLPYPVLLILQLVLLGLMLWGARAIPLTTPRVRLGRILIGCACIYIAVMVVRLLVGALELSEHRWFAVSVPTAFHFVLAGYLLAFGCALGQAARPGALVPAGGALQRWISLLAYPCIVAVSLLLFMRLVSTGSPLMFSAYLGALIGASAILVHEALLPFREDWRPQRQEVLSDAMFLVLVQVVLPALLKILALTLVLWLAAGGSPLRVEWLSRLWPQHLPIVLQVTLMLVVAEFFRYWIHRGSHHYKMLWQLHAVHHASTRLYTVNVGRFHPLDKSLQFLGDSLPFLLLGIAPEVFAAYFVFYAINGFYQHSNAMVRLGWLNWFIAGPELHRWHHSAQLSEAKSNFGNNLIIWDTIFATRYLPADTSIGRIGVQNPAWPTGFWAQLLAPFTTSTEVSSRSRTAEK